MKKKFQRLPQPTSKELTDACLDFLRRKFYTDDAKSFAQDRSRLLEWVVLWPASWLNEKGVTIHGDAYREIFFKTFFQADMNRASRIKYRPAWLCEVIQSHFRIHGEDYYEEAKAVRSLAEHALLVAGKLPTATAPDVTSELALSHRLLLGLKAKKQTSRKSGFKETLNLELNLT